mmetsp:Transcript_24506/g.56473  ORF Transcript_24506/g.56473 Transcript_24506/m.56473 type:complete len:371 (-) Transcript_24506:66-1178(-)
MKLKKFLLRYEPPGVGLEVEHADGDIDVRHKDLPSTNGNWSGRDIYGLVDGLIEEESDILSRRKHRAALVGLLSRLYKVEVGPEDDDDGEDDRQQAPPDKKPADERHHGGKNTESSGVYEGQQVVLVRLIGKQQVFNGEVAEVTKAKGDKGKFEVQLKNPKGNEGESKFKVKGIEHLIPLLTSDKASLEVNVLVCIRGLRNHIELNGCLGRIQQCHVDSHRYEVRAIESGQLFRVKQENLLLVEACPQLGAMKENKDPNMQPPAPAGGGGEAGTGQEQTNQAIGDMGIDGEVLEPGSIIQLHGLKSAMQFNGQAAEVLSIDRNRGRYEIQLNDGSVKTVRAENVKLISKPTKPSPRGKARSGTGGAAKKA